MNYENIGIEAVERIVCNAAQKMKSKQIDVVQKDGYSNIVTSCDLAVQQQLCNNLHKLLPEAAFYCEEENLRNASSIVWGIDPIDGTTNFSRNQKDCAISVALVYEGKPVLAVVYSPDSNLLYTAQKGKGAFCNNKPIFVSNRSMENSIVCGGFSVYDKSKAPYCWKIFEELFYKSNDFRCIGSAALGLSAIAAGKYEMFFEIRLSPWDYAAAQLLITEAGGIVTTKEGTLPTFDRPQSIVAANSKENHQVILQIVQKNIDCK